nr:GNAT family N-acetyltransferase [Clostridia bacterium]
MSDNIEIRRMKKGDAEACFGMMNLVFKQAKPGHPDFQDILPKMTIDDDEHMNKHFGLYADGKLCAVLGVYPLPVKVGGVELLGSTVGNVATHPDETGKGYMTKLLAVAMDELERIGADMSRLGGKRERYNRYGYEQSGTNVRFSMSVDQAAVYGDGIEFRKITPDDTELLHKCEELFYALPIAVSREDDKGFWLSLIAWQNVPWAAFDRNGEFIGYISASAEGPSIAETAAKSPELMREMLCAWCKKCGKPVSFFFYMSQPAEIAVMDEICRKHTASFPCHFFIRKWDRVCDAFVKLKASYTDMPDAECIIGIEGWGNLKFTAKDGKACAVKTDEAASVVLGHLDATRYIFGPNPHTAEGPDAPGASVFFPLPLSWNLQDRV